MAELAMHKVKSPVNHMVMAYMVLALVGLAVYTVLGCPAWFLFVPKNPARLHCAGFATREEIVSSFKAGNSGLDGDGDHIPCENRM